MKEILTILLTSVFLLSGLTFGGLFKQIEQIEDKILPTTLTTVQASPATAFASFTTQSRDSDGKPHLSYTPHAPISINSNADFTSANGVVSGNGTQSNPYIIENWDIDGHRTCVIYIGNTTAYFVVRNCYLRNGSYDAGIQLYNVQNGLLENNICSDNYFGILLSLSSGNTLTYNTCSNNAYGIHLRISSSNTLANNTCNSNGHDGIYLYSSSDNTLTYNTCNSNNDYGISLYSSSSNTLTYNTMFVNGLLISGDSLNDYIQTIDTTNTVNRKPIYYYKHQTGITVPSDAGEVILVNCTNFVVENLVLDKCGVGIALVYSSCVSVRNNICSNNYLGIWLYYSSNSTLADNNCNSNNRYGIFLDSSSFNTLANNTCNSNNYDGISLYSSSNSLFTYNTCSNNDYGIHLRISSSNMLANNTCNSNSYVGIYLCFSSGNTLTYNTCNSNKAYGISLYSSSSSTLTYNTMIENGLVISGDSLNDYIQTIDTTNTVNGKPIYYYKHQTGITVPSDAGEVILVNCTNFIVENLVLNKCSVGIALVYSSYVSVRNNICSNNRYGGIYLYSSSGNTLTYNTCNLNYRGIELYSSSSNTLTYNTCNSNNGDGIYLMDSSSNTLTYNTCLNNYDGIYLAGSSGNTLAYNNITGNTRYGVYSGYSNSNRIHHNNFINNRAGGVQAYDDTGTNYWNDTTEGNYWSDYTTRYPNAHQVGNVWDIPYALFGWCGQDNYPLVNPVSNAGPGVPELQSFLPPIIGLVILFLVIGGFAKRKR